MDLSIFCFWNCPLSILWISRCEFQVDQPTIQNKISLHRCVDWPGSILVIRVNGHDHYWCKTTKEILLLLDNGNFKTDLLKKWWGTLIIEGSLQGYLLSELGSSELVYYANHTLVWSILTKSTWAGVKFTKF